VGYAHTDHTYRHYQDSHAIPRGAEWYAGVAMGITVFTPAPLPANDAIRSEAAIQSGLLRRVNDQALCDIASDARRLLKARWCGITVIIGDTQHVIASSGGMLGQYRRSTSLSSYIIHDPETVFIVLNAARDDRFAGNPFVDDGLICFYAGAAIFNEASLAIGALCITSRESCASFSDDEAQLLCHYADMVAATLIG
jgi:GAF domain-containing protein